MAVNNVEYEQIPGSLVIYTFIMRELLKSGVFRIVKRSLRRNSGGYNGSIRYLSSNCRNRWSVLSCPCHNQTLNSSRYPTALSAVSSTRFYCRAASEQGNTVQPSALGITSYEEEVKTWRVEVPEYFNFAKDVVDHWAEVATVRINS
jgi:hypothetical protein